LDAFIAEIAICFGEVLQGGLITVGESPFPGVYFMSAVMAKGEGIDLAILVYCIAEVSRYGIGCMKGG
jgi:hypothetical protein